jgi:hypothetical protein
VLALASQCRESDEVQFNLPDNPLDRPQPGEPGIKLPNQAQSVVSGDGLAATTLLERDKDKGGGADIDYLQVRYTRDCMS